jgi:excisionase family DNA binding protein
MDDGESIVSVREAARILRVSEQYVRRMLSRGILSGTRIGRTWAVRRHSAMALLEKRRILPLFGRRGRGRS